MTKKKDRVILRVFEKNPLLSLRDGQAVLRKKSLNICDTIRRCLLSYEVKFQSTVKKPLLSKNTSNKDTLQRKKIWTVIGIYKVIFSAKSSLWARSSIHHTWSIHINRLIRRTVKHPVKVHWVISQSKNLALCTSLQII